MIITEDTRTQYAVKGTMPRYGKLQLHVKTGHLYDTDRERMVQAVEDERFHQEHTYKIAPDAELVTRSWTGDGWTEWEPVADEPAEDSEETPFDPSTLILTADDIHALAQPGGDVLAWDHHKDKVRAMTREEAIAAGFVASTNRGWLNDWTRDPGCWDADRTDVTPECAERLAGALNEWLRRIA